MNNTIFKTANRVLRKGTLKFRKHSPEILVGAGIIGGVTSAVLACRATTKVSEVLEESKHTIDQIHYVMESDEYDNETYSEEDAKKDLTIVYAKSALKIAKLYAPSVLLGAASIGSILKGHSILRGRNIALAAAYAGLDKGFKEYRDRVVDRFGETVDNELKYGIKAKKITQVEVDENTGKEKKVKKTIDVVEDNCGYSPYARCFDESCAAWEKDPEYNMMTLRAIQAHMNDKLIANGVVTLNEVYDELGIPRSRAGQVVGWVYDKGNPLSDGHIEFGIYDINREPVRDFINGYERSIMLDFNVDGYILDYM